jgi:ABC-type Na+ efflux pump permease subunit
VLVATLLKSPAQPAAGLARFEFNIYLREITAFLVWFGGFSIAVAAADSVAAEREKDTWAGLIATPLSGLEILRAKTLGAIWHARAAGVLLFGLWSLGLLAGAVHPLGLLAACAGVAISGAFFATWGVYASLWARSREEASGRVVPLVLLLVTSSIGAFVLPGGRAKVLLAAGSAPVLVCLSLLSYEDAAAAMHTGTFPPLGALGLHASITVVAAAWLIGTAAHAAGAFWFARAAMCGFDAAVDRPRRGRSVQPLETAPARELPLLAPELIPR